MALEPWAKSQAQALMAPLGDRWRHIQAVERVGAHCQHLGIDLDQMAALLHAERQEGCW